MPSKLVVLWKVKEMTSLLFSLRWDINKAVAHECGRGHLKLVSARKRIGQAGATERSPPPPPPPRGDRTRHAAARRRRSESHPFTRYLTVDTPPSYLPICKFYKITDTNKKLSQLQSKLKIIIFYTINVLLTTRQLTFY